MTNPFTPPASEVRDMAPEGKSHWLRTALLVMAFGGLSLAVAWTIAPLVAGGIARVLGINGNAGLPAFLAIDLALSTLTFFAGCYLAAHLSHGHAFVAAAGVAFMGWIVYFTEVGGLQGMLNSEYPRWYEFFPEHCVAAIAAWLLARRRLEDEDVRRRAFA
jgi:hypothetical protein